VSAVSAVGAAAAAAAGGGGAGVGVGGALRIGYAELEGATGGFNAARRLGEGGFGAVYAGTYRHTAVAVKRLERGELAAACGMTTADSLDNEARRRPPASRTPPCAGRQASAGPQPPQLAALSPLLSVCQDCPSRSRLAGPACRHNFA
jgi:hypothetical protein